MEGLNKQGKIDFNKNQIDTVKKEFDTYSSDNANTVKTIKKFYDNYGYVLDPHTACGIFAAQNLKSVYPECEFVCLATAHPAKFGDVVEKAIGKPAEIPEEIKNLFDKKKRIIVLENDIEKVKNFLSENFK
jgi:threonine synthase